MSLVRTESHAPDLLRGVVDCIDRDHLLGRLGSGASLRIKFGIDPSAPDIHLGHTVPMRLLRRWQAAGHLPVLIIGDYTARIGDPSGRSATRPQLSPEEVARNVRTYLDQLFMVVDRERVEVHMQSEWYGGFGLDRLLALARTTTVAQMLQRSDFQQRLAQERPIGVHELLYPLMQGYDSVAIHADVELGGTDQLFNLLRGREIQLAYGLAPQDVLTVPLLVGTDGQRKMSKSLGNAVGVTDAAEEQFGRLMSLPDAQIVPYLELLTEAPDTEIESLRRQLTNPRDLKAAMARRVVSQFHGSEAAERAAAEFDRIFKGHELPAEIDEVAVPAGPRDPRELLRLSGLAPSRTRALQFLREGGVHLDERRLDPDERLVEYRDGSILRYGRRQVVRLRVAAADTATLAGGQ